MRYLFAFFASLLFFISLVGQADPRMEAKSGTVTIILYDEPCRLGHMITNLGYRTTWSEGPGGKMYEGCFSLEAGFVLFFFEDKTIGIIPMEVFSPIIPR